MMMSTLAPVQYMQARLSLSRTEFGSKLTSAQQIMMAQKMSTI
jgi:hypothetical protein